MDWRRLVAACFGLGWLPGVPGTWGSALPAGVFALLLNLDMAAGSIAVVMVGLILAGSVACVICTSASASARGKTDPGEIVVDEVAGQSLTLLSVLPLLPAEPSVRQIWLTTILGFLLFRVFDIAKPWPIRKLESLPAGWGVLADDLLAGVYAAVVLLLCMWRFVKGLS
jgi:phosphatidylglycerophosphatase A